MTHNPKLDFCESFVHLHGARIRFDARPYLPAIYGSRARHLVIRGSRQIEKSTFICNTILYELVTRPGISILLVCPRQEQARVLVRGRVLPALQESPLVRRRLLGKTRQPRFSHMQFANGSQLYVRAAYRSADAVRGISADLLLVDEVQDIAAGDLPVLQETLSHSKLRRTILTGTPKLVENHLEAAFARSTANEWKLTCPGCAAQVILDENSLGPHGIVCRHCQGPLDAATGRWVARNPDSEWGDGFWVNHLMVPWQIYGEIRDREIDYDRAKFKNEVLGLSTTLGEHVVTRAELEACCADHAMAKSAKEIPAAHRANIIAGVDWGGGSRARTVVTIGFMRPDYVFEVCRFECFRANEDPVLLVRSVANVCRTFRVRWIAVDGDGNGHVFNRLLLDELKHDSMYAIHYSDVSQEPKQEGALWKWTVNRSGTIGAVFGRVRKRSIVFPRVDECGSFLDEFACEQACYDDANRTIRYTHPETTQDDALHATNYALLAGMRYYYARMGQ